MTNLNEKSVNFHNNFVKTIEPSEKQIQKLAEFGYDEEFTKLFVNAVNWIVTNDNKNKSMKYFKKNQPLVDEGLAEVFEEDGQKYLRLTNKAEKIMSGKKNKINVAQLPRQKVKQSKGYFAKEEIPQEVQDFLEVNGLKVLSTVLTKAAYTLKVTLPDSKKLLKVMIYENKIKFRYYGNKRIDMYNHSLERIDSSLIEHHKMSNSFGYILIDMQSLNKITSGMLF